MWILLFGLAALVGTVVISAHSHQAWIGFWEHVGETLPGSKKKS